MLETPHVALGIAMAVKTGNPWVAIPLSLASHFLLDRVPHWNPHFYTETQKFGQPKKISTYIAVVDEMIAIALTLFIAYKFMPDVNKSFLILICSLLSVLPDQIKIPYFFCNRRFGLIKKWVDFERSIQVEVGPVWGILTQTIVVLVSFYWVFS
ncbi:hypothetical protein A2130_00825 [Candidatus Woesebacteria bacterium GWC2_33_12]|uniref:Uncharacterized protein n=1 Tax=Candidatus Woesebacteria bacterium GW2011_GWB1_33_22 TaxID=1618566 RepID=A0A0F9ZLZ9_9BACT|nr:MAG: hypothetical protein UR29_C0002G0058 [Candidatus Woesebacteria bacterium GW2011_GWC2_33_12]KKP42530.1 MAG: hypothetical protein UR33_C0002G0106 [Candidatus Woesebacteria bacterium GW2011_GWA2_33_20]KKP45273.1 MAG: hypothetical protein UR35_C0002G0106 [Candidatus Woesebacteria bacterium GW2011_GWB1_33_22]KKP47101.1 MAG: hypothetical protein UR37_C0002G0013 [Microgenomates group bacterium GW2011_GWC1_33_28]KKP50943.1 MAG: hypothetical protein UR41_C0002G0107 [Candidatus Woesebacteria bact